MNPQVSANACSISSDQPNDSLRRKNKHAPSKHFGRGGFIRFQSVLLKFRDRFVRRLRDLQCFAKINRLAEKRATNQCARNIVDVGKA